MEDEALIAAVGRAQQLVISGDRDGAHGLYEELWHEALHAADQHRACVVAHFMAHAQVEPEAQLAWHLRSLHAAEAAGDERVRAYYPSLHANLAETYLRLGDVARAQIHIQKAQAFEHLLPDDFYGHMIRSLIVRVAQTVERDRTDIH